ncbi:Xaa-Pro dipeptidase [archaeon GW2011_AR15]|nr:Xaa-Pro dipeptidase [archaeon GW2011_AR15]MBS3103916.1 aminopeptidase P family protein [Candidatus Woesearchaeota archaeon]
MRIRKLQSALEEKNIGAAFFFCLDNPPNVNMEYLAGYLGLGILVITQKSSFLLAPEMEYERALKTKLKVYKAEKKKFLLEILSRILSRSKIDKAGIEENKCSVALYKRLKKSVKARYTDISGLCAEIRMVKEDKEIAYMQKASDVADRVFSDICRNFRFRSEGELKKFIEGNIRKAGCELSFPPIVASGKGSSQPHYAGDKKIENGFLLLDFGAKYRGYCSDMSRMLYMGNPTKEELGNYSLVLGVLAACESEVKEGVAFSELYNSAIKMFNSHAEFFTHALGHGVGLEIHEPPSLYSEDKKHIKENIVFTIEPGLYFPGKYGIRVEDTVVLKNSRLKILTKSKKELVIIK